MVSVVKVPPATEMVNALVETTKVPLAIELVIFLAPLLHPIVPPPVRVSVCPFKSKVVVAFEEDNPNAADPVTTILVPVAIFKFPVP